MTRRKRSFRERRRRKPGQAGGQPGPLLGPGPGSCGAMLAETISGWGQCRTSTRWTDGDGAGVEGLEVPLPLPDLERARGRDLQRFQGSPRAA